MKLITAEVLHFNSSTNQGVARYSDDMGNSRTVHFFGDDHHLLEHKGDNEIVWRVDIAPLPIGSFTHIVFSKAERGLVEQWTTVGEAEPFLSGVK